MKKILFIPLCIVLSFMTMDNLDAQCFFNPDQQKWESTNGGPCGNTVFSAVPFLRITPDARTGGMGDAGIAISGDANSMHYNTSKLAFVEKEFSLSATYSPWLRDLGLQDVYLAYLAGYKKLNEFEAIGLSLRYFSLGDVAFTDENGQPIGNGRPNEFEVAVGYARKLSDKLSVGINGKFIFSNLAAGQVIGNTDIKAAIAGAADISFTYSAPSGEYNNLTAGLVLSNIGSRISYTQSTFRDYLPANLGLGVAYDFNFDDFNKLTITLDANKLMVPTPIFPELEPGTPNPEYDSNGNGEPDFKEQGTIGALFSSFGDAPNGFSEELKEFTFSLGAEYWYEDQFAVRAGYFYENPLKGNRQYLTLGLGIKYNIFGMNISYLVPTNNQRSPLDNTLRFSLIFNFDEEGTPDL